MFKKFERIEVLLPARVVVVVVVVAEEEGEKLEL